MISSILKDIDYNNPPAGDYIEDQEDRLTYFSVVNNNAQPVNQSKKNPRPETRVELNLPKAKITRKGQLLLYTNGKDDEEKQAKTYLTANKNWMGSSGAENFVLDSTQLLDTQIFQDNQATESLKTVKLGKNTDYFVNQLRTKSGKNKYKPAYMEYLPAEFDSKSYATPASARSRFMTNQSKMSSFYTDRYSSYSEANDFISSDDETDSKMKTSASILSHQPILSTEKLINRLSCKLDPTLFSSAKNQSNESYTDRSTEEPSSSIRQLDHMEESTTAHASTTPTSVNYKKVFLLSDLDNEKAEDLYEESSCIYYDLERKNAAAAETNLTTASKILNKRVKSGKTNTSFSKNVHIKDYDQLQSPKSANNLNLLRNRKSQGSKSATSARKLSPKSRTQPEDWSDKHSSFQFSIMNNYNSYLNHQTGKENLPNLLLTNRSYKTTGGSNTALPKSRIILNEGQEEPITIKVDEIRASELHNQSISNHQHYSDGEGPPQVIRVRKFFDRDSVRIKKININENFGKKSMLNTYTDLRKANKQKETYRPPPLVILTTDEEIITRIEDNQPIKQQAQKSPTELKVNDSTIRPSARLTTITATDLNEIRMQSAPIVELNEFLSDEIKLSKSATPRMAKNFFKSNPMMERQDPSDVTIKNDDDSSPDQILTIDDIQSKSDAPTEFVINNELKLAKLSSGNSGKSERIDVIEEEMIMEQAGFSVIDENSEMKTDNRVVVEQFFAILELNQANNGEDLTENSHGVEETIEEDVIDEEENRRILQQMEAKKRMSLRKKSMTNNSVSSRKSSVITITPTESVENEKARLMQIETIKFHEKPQLKRRNSTYTRRQSTTLQQGGVNVLRRSENEQDDKESGETPVHSTFNSHSMPALSSRYQSDSESNFVDLHKVVNSNADDNNNEPSEDEKVLDDLTTQYDRLSGLRSNLVSRDKEFEGEMTELTRRREDKMARDLKENESSQVTVEKELVIDETKPEVVNDSTVVVERSNTPGEQKIVEPDTEIDDKKPDLQIDNAPTTQIVENMVDNKENSLEKMNLEGEETKSVVSDPKAKKVEFAESVQERLISKEDPVSAVVDAKPEELKSDGEQGEMEDYPEDYFKINPTVWDKPGDKKQNKADQGQRVKSVKEKQPVAVHQPPPAVETKVKKEVKTEEKKVEPVVKEKPAPIEKAKTKPPIVPSKNVKNTRQSGKTAPKPVEVKVVEPPPPPEVPKEPEVEAKNSTLDKLNEKMSKINALLGIKEPEPEKVPEKKPLPKKKEKYYPHLAIPWKSKEPVVDIEAYNKAFHVPAALCPHLHRLDFESVSVDELTLERRILEEKIAELRQSKLKTESGVKEAPKKETKANKKAKKKEELKKLKEQEAKDKVIKEERLRLQNESIRRKNEIEDLRLFLTETITQKESEIEQLQEEFSQNKQEYDKEYNQIQEQIEYLDANEEQIRQILARSHAEMYEKMMKNQQLRRKQLAIKQEETKQDKQLEFDIKRKELDWLLQLHGDPEEQEKIRAQLGEFEIEVQQWMAKFEIECGEEEHDLDDFEQEEDNRLEQMGLDNEENSLNSLKEEQSELLQEKRVLIENFEAIKTKIEERIKQVKEEKERLKKELENLEENVLKDFENQRAKLLEIWNAEEQARMSVKQELEEYKKSLLKTREKNLKMRYNLSFLNHCHHITKPYVFTYNVEWPIELFSKPSGDNKKTSRKSKK